MARQQIMEEGRSERQRNGSLDKPTQTYCPMPLEDGVEHEVGECLVGLVCGSGTSALSGLAQGWDDGENE